MKRCPGRNVQEWASWRWVSGMPAVAAHPLDALTLGTIERELCRLKRLHLFTATAENARIFAFQAHHAAHAAGVLHKQAVDLVLLHKMLTSRLPDTDPLGLGGHQCEHVSADQAVVDHHFRATYAIECAQGKKIGRHGPCSHHVHSTRCLRCRNVQAAAGYVSDPKVSAKVNGTLYLRSELPQAPQGEVADEWFGKYIDAVPKARAKELGFDPAEVRLACDPRVKATARWPVGSPYRAPRGNW